MTKETNHIYNRTGEKPFTIANSDLLLNKELTVNDKMIYLYLRLYGGQNRLAFTGLERMAEEINLSINTIRKSLKHLEDKSYIKITKEKQKHGYFLNNYHIYDPHNNKPDNVTNIKENTKKELPQQDSPNRNVDIMENEYEYIISYFNERANKSFKSTSKKTRELINGRLKEGYTLEDFKYVIDVKTEQWLNNEKMDKHLAPITLFRPSNFEKYLNEKPKKPKNKSYLTDLLGGDE